MSRAIECISLEQLAGNIPLKEKQRPNATRHHLQSDLEEYQLIIVDDAHNYPTPNIPTRAVVLSRLLFVPKRDPLLLTPITVNNSLWDLYYIVRYFIPTSAHLADQGILSIKQRYLEAMRTNPTDLSPDVLYPIIDAKTIKRTREFVKNIIHQIPSRYQMEHQNPSSFQNLMQLQSAMNWNPNYLAFLINLKMR
ncbi:MAG: hypothetical protein OXF08_07440 [Bacteroidetes bacterium]|nr:hypothetical protein [Bacteroidota bacterium]